MRVLQVVDSLVQAGAETVICNLSKGLREFGVESEIYALRRSGSNLETECAKEKIRVHYSGLQNLYSLRQIARLASHLRGNEYDVIHSHLFPAQLWTAIAKETGQFSTPLVTTEHNTSNRRRNSFFRRADKWMYGKYDCIVGVSEAVSEALTGAVTQNGSVTQTIHNGVPLSRIKMAPTANLKSDLGIGVGKLAISVGRCERQKNHLCSLRALATTPSDIHLAIAGEGSLMSELRLAAGELGIANRVHFLGHRDDVLSLLKAADFFVQASSWEGFGVAAVEAMAAGVPVIAAEVPGLREVVGDAGTTFKADDHEQLGKIMAELAANSDLREVMSERGRARALCFDLSQACERHARLYSSLSVELLSSRQSNCEAGIR